jgi:hypothetical protein
MTAVRRQCAPATSPTTSPARRQVLRLAGQCAWLAAATAVLAPPPAQAQPAAPETAAPPELAGAWPQPARLLGQARFRFFGLHIYDAQLWAPQPLRQSTWAEQPLALVLLYARKLEGARIAQRSLDEMRRAGPLEEARAERWLAAMRGLFPDVSDGERITGQHLPGDAARFWVNGRLAGDVKDVEFARRFFGIWLAPHTSEPGLRQQLLAGAAP